VNVGPPRGEGHPCIQEDWESGLTILLPKAMKKGEAFSVEVALEGDFIDNQDKFLNCYYPQDNNGWYPKHGYLKRSTFKPCSATTRTTAWPASASWSAKAPGPIPVTA
jgi:hypothetical protein